MDTAVFGDKFWNGYSEPHITHLPVILIEQTDIHRLHKFLCDRRISRRWKKIINLSFMIKACIAIQKTPLRIKRMDQQFLFYFGPLLNFFFSSYSIPDKIKTFVINQVITIVSAGECFVVAL